MKLLRAILFFHLAASVCGEVLYPQPLISQSRSFLVHDARPQGRASLPPKPVPGRQWTPIEPAVLAVSADRIRSKLHHLLKLTVYGRPAIDLVVCPATPTPQGIRIAADYYADGWRYRLATPDFVDRRELVHGMVHLLLLEVANHGAGRKSAEIPLWLIEGLSTELLSEMGPDLLPDAPPLGVMLRDVRQYRGADSLAEARNVLRQNPRLTFADLSDPNPSLLEGANLELFRRSSQLLVTEVLRLPNGPLRLALMLQKLPHCWNWQTAMLESFQTLFPRMLDLEKWWTLAVVDFIGRERGQILSEEVIWERLHEILATKVRMVRTSDQLPIQMELSLQEVIAQWTFANQRSLIEAKLLALTKLRNSSTRSSAEIVENYRSVLSEYVRARTEAELAPNSKRQAIGLVQLAVVRAIRQLNELDVELRALKEGAVSVPEETAQPQP